MSPARTSPALRFVTGPVRPGSHPVHLYNDGLTVLLYDAAHEDALREADPAVLHGIGDDTFDDPATRDAMTAGRLLVYGMVGDGGTHAEVVVGEPLTKKELASGRWQVSRDGWLDLPSGRLMVHSYNSLPLGDGGTGDEGATIEVAPGRYRVRIHRKDWDALAEAGRDWLEDAAAAGMEEKARVDDVITLTPLDGAAPAGANVLFGECVGYEDPEAKALGAPTRGVVRDGAWHGQVIKVVKGKKDVADPALYLDFDPAAARELGLVQGSRVMLEAEGQSMPLFWFGAPLGYGAVRAALGTDGLRALADGTGVYALPQQVADHRESPVKGYLAWAQVTTEVVGKAPPLLALKVGTPVTMRPAGEPWPLGRVPAARVEGGAVHGEVVASVERAMILSVDEAAIAALAPGAEGRLELTVGDRTLSLIAAEATKEWFDWTGKRWKEECARAPYLFAWGLVPAAQDPGRKLVGVRQLFDADIMPQEARAAWTPLVAPAGTPVTVRKAKGR